jgi:hypothetical protein
MSLLANPKTAYIKKRQLMRTSFGDYRAKMEKEEKKFRLGNTITLTLIYFRKAFLSKSLPFHKRGSPG